METSKQKTLRKFWLNIRLTEAEHRHMMQAFSRTTDKKLSSYARKLLLGKPVKIIYKDATLDAFVQEMVVLRKELNGIGNNFNQLIKRIHSVWQTPEQLLLLKYSEKMQAQLVEKASQITSCVRKITEQWYQNS